MRRAVIGAILILILVVVAVAPFNGGRDGNLTPPPSDPGDEGAGPLLPGAEIGSDGSPSSPGDEFPDPPLGCLLFKVVSDDEQTPVPGAEIEVFRSEAGDWMPVARAAGDLDGLIRFEGLSTALWLHGIIEAPGFGRKWIWVGRPSSQPRAEVVRLGEPVPVEGSVVDAVTGAAIAGARIEAHDYFGLFMDDACDFEPGPVLSAGTSGPGGSFRLPHSGSLLLVSAEGYATVRKSIGGGPDPVEIRLVPGAVLLGTVTGSDGKPFPGARIFACPAFAPTYRFRPPASWRLREGFRWGHSEPGAAYEDVFAAERAIADQSGRYRLPGLIAEIEYHLWVEGYGEAERLLRSPIFTGVRGGRGESVRMDLLLPNGASIDLRVTGPDGRGVGPARIRLQPSPRPGWPCEWNGEEVGRLVRDGLVPGRFDAGISAPGYRRVSFELVLEDGGRLEKTIVLQPDPDRPAPDPDVTVRIRGTVVNDLGVAIAGARVTCADGRRPERLTDASGRFEFEKSGRTYPSVCASLEGHYEAVESGWSLPDKELRLVLARCINLIIPIRLPEGEPTPEMIQIARRSEHGGGSGSYSWTDRVRGANSQWKPGEISSKSR